MKNLLKTVMFFLLIFVFACDEEKPEIHDDFTIEFGTVCGWCAGEELIKVSQTGIKYIRTIPCGENEGTTQKEKSISATEWDEINLAFDYALFKTLEYNECNVCVDGCDEYIKITENDNIHEIRYSPGIQIDGVDDLRSALNAILVEMRESN
jgi:hypothetical protein